MRTDKLRGAEKTCERQTSSGISINIICRSLLHWGLGNVAGPLTVTEQEEGVD